MNAAIRKAAILVSALDPPSADALLAQMDPRTAAQIREVARKLRGVEERERQQVLEEFLARGQADRKPASSTPAERLAAAGQDEALIQHAPPPPAPRRRFHFLQTVDAATLADRLLTEHPQTIALVAAHAPRRLAADLLWRFPESLRSDILARILDWQGTDPQLLEELERALEISLAVAPSTPAGAAGLSAVREILDVVSTDERSELLENLRRHAPGKAELLRRWWRREEQDHPVAASPVTAPADEISPATEQEPPPASDPAPDNAPPPPLKIHDPAGEDSEHLSEKSPRGPSLNFADLARLDDAALSRVFAAVDPHTTLFALTGASPRLVERVLRRLPRKEAAQLKRRMETLAPFSLRDIEAAQIQLVQVASRLAQEGRLRPPARRRAA